MLKAYNQIWLATEERDFADELISALTRPRNQVVAVGDDDKEIARPLSDPLFQIIQVFQKNAVRTVAQESIESDSLYLHYAELMARSCGPPEGEADEDGDDDEEDGEGFEQRETEKQHLIYCQQRLHERGAAEMVLQVNIEVVFQPKFLELDKFLPRFCSLKFWLYKPARTDQSEFR